MKLLLSGGGDSKQVKPLDEYFCNYIKRGKVLYIPVAMEKISYKDCEEWFLKTYPHLKNVDVGTDLSQI